MVFSSIKNQLREIRGKIAKIAQHNNKLISNSEPWISLFGVAIQPSQSPLSEFPAQQESAISPGFLGSPSTMHVAVPKNPFSVEGSSDLIERAIMKGFPSETLNESSNTVILSKSRFGQYETIVADSEENESNLLPFSFDMVPEIFKEEANLVKVYEFIAESRDVSETDVLKKFNDVSEEKIKIFIGLLCSKRFVRRVCGRLSIRK